MRVGVAAAAAEARRKRRRLMFLEFMGVVIVAGWACVIVVTSDFGRTICGGFFRDATVCIYPLIGARGSDMKVGR